MKEKVRARGEEESSDGEGKESRIGMIKVRSPLLGAGLALSLFGSGWAWVMAGSG